MRPITWSIVVHIDHHRWDCISINERPVNAREFLKIEKHYQDRNIKKKIDASPFEILTATAFHLFNEEKIDVGVVEVGMGGRLDATNILHNQVVSVVSKIARDHEGFLGTTLGEIARHKAGILRPNVPYIVNPRNEPNVHQVIDDCAKEVGAGPRLSSLGEMYSTPDWRQFAGSLRPFQRDNATLAVLAVKETLKDMGKEGMSGAELAAGLMRHRHVANPGRLQYLRAMPVFGSPGSAGRQILVDGAHNPDAAIALDDFVSNNERLRDALTNEERPVTWVLAMTEGKDADKFLRTLLRPKDNIITTSFDPVDGMPWVKPTPPEALLEAAKNAEPGITGIAMPKPGPLRALCAARYLAEQNNPIVLTGSLYLVGNLLKDLRPSKDETWWSDDYYEDDRAMFEEIHAEERERIYRLLSGQDTGVIAGNFAVEEKVKAAAANRKALQDEIRTLDEELERLNVEERRGPINTPPIKTPQIVHRSTHLDQESLALPILPDDKFFGRIVDIRKSLEALERPTNIRSRSAITDPDMQLQMEASTYIGKLAEVRKRKKDAEKELRSIPNEELAPDQQTLEPKIHLHYAKIQGVENRRSRAATLEMGKKPRMGEHQRVMVRRVKFGQ